MYFLDDWHDWVRLVNTIFCIAAAYIMASRYLRDYKDWNRRTRDFWFALWTWNLAGCIGSLEGIVQNLEPGSRLVFVAAGSLATLVALTRKGVWGSTEVQKDA